MRKIGKGRAPEVVNGPFRSVQRSGRCGVGELLDGSCDPAPGIGTVVITVSRELVDTRAALLERFVAVAPQHQSGGTPDIDLGYHAKKIAGLPSKKRLTPIIAWLAKLRVKVAADGIDIDRRRCGPAHCRRVRLCRQTRRRRDPA
jgi:hypothetical protein